MPPFFPLSFLLTHFPAWVAALLRASGQEVVRDVHPVTLSVFPLGGPRPVPGNCVIPAARGKGTQLSGGEPAPKQSS